MRFATILSILAARASAITLPTHFASSMVFLRDASTVFWGLSSPADVVTVTYRGVALAPATADATGRFSVSLPAMPANATPDVVTIASALGDRLTLNDTLVGDVYVCSGQSNMEIIVSWSAHYNSTLNQIAALGLGARLRLLKVALDSAYPNVTVPADNFTAEIPWSRATADTAFDFSAFCYNFGADVAIAQPDLPVGLIVNAWGGVDIQVWMSPAALASCSATNEPRVSGSAQLVLDSIAAADRAASSSRGSAGPSIPSCLYNSMMHPILSIPVTGLLW